MAKATTGNAVMALLRFLQRKGTGAHQATVKKLLSQKDKLKQLLQQSTRNTKIVGGIGAGTTVGAGGLGYALGSREKSSLDKSAIVGTAIGGLHGLLRTPDKGEDRFESMLTGGARGLATDKGAITGLGIGAGVGLPLAVIKRNPKIAAIAALLGLLGGGYTGYKRMKIRTRRRGELGLDDDEETKEASMDVKKLGAMAAAAGMAKEAGLLQLMQKLQMVSPGFGKRLIGRSLGKRGLSRIERMTGRPPLAIHKGMERAFNAIGMPGGEQLSRQIYSPEFKRQIMSQL